MKSNGGTDFSEHCIAAIFAHTFSNDQVVVTVDVGSFITLAPGVDLHPGVIVLREAELRAELQ